MRADQWAGLVTKASPYAIPHGAAVEQVNLSSSIPGQLTVRNGMRKVIGMSEVQSALDCFAFDFGGTSVIVAMLPDGALVPCESPHYAPAPSMPNEPVFGIQSGHTGVTYTNRFVTGPASEAVPQPPADSPYRSSVGGGGASTNTWEGTVAAGTNVSSATTRAYKGGNSATPEFPPTLITLQ